MIQRTCRRHDPPKRAADKRIGLRKTMTGTADSFVDAANGEGTES